MGFGRRPQDTALGCLFAGLVGGSLDGIAIGAFISLGLVVVLMALKERAFCQFLCPLGALFALMPVLGFLSYKRKCSACIPNCGRCNKSCPVDIWPDEDVMHGECISCGRCANACPIENVSLIALEKASDASPVSGDAASGNPAEVSKGAEPSKQRKAGRGEWWIVTGTEIPVMVGKALILLVLFWVLGATRYLPAFSEIAAALGLSG